MCLLFNGVFAHVTAVGEDEVDLAAAVNQASMADVGAYEVPLLLPVGAEAGLRAVEGDGLGGLGGAVGVDVADLDSLTGGAEGAEADGDIGVGHVQRVGVVRAADGARGGGVDIRIAHGGAARERQADVVAAAGLERIFI